MSGDFLLIGTFYRADYVKIIDCKIGVLLLFTSTVPKLKPDWVNSIRPTSLSSKAIARAYATIFSNAESHAEVTYWAK